jgi:hypothetical protein
VIQEGILETVEDGSTRCKSLDRGDLAALNLRDGNQTRANRLPIEQNCARAAIAGITSDFGSRQTEIFTEHA